MDRFEIEQNVGINKCIQRVEALKVWYTHRANNGPPPVELAHIIQAMKMLDGLIDEMRTLWHK